MLCSAALHTQSGVRNQIPNEDQGSASQEAGHSHIDFVEWHKYPKLCSAIFSLHGKEDSICEIPEGGLSPERHEAIILCLLSFPAIDLAVDQEKDGSGLKTQNTADGVNISIQKHNPAVGMSLSVPFAPQQVGIVLRLAEIRQRYIEISLSLSVEGQFSWEAWRNEFTTRLEEGRRLHESDGIVFSPIIRGRGSITDGLVSAEVSTCGTGQKMEVWSGWLPQRPNMCRFEMESDGFIIEVKKKKLDLKFSREWNITQSMGLVKSKCAPVRYVVANNLDLEHACAATERIMLAVADGSEAETVFTLSGTSVLAEKMNEEFIGSEKTEKEFRLRLSEAVAVYHQSFDVLQKAVLYLCTMEYDGELLLASGGTEINV